MKKKITNIEIENILKDETKDITPSIYSKIVLANPEIEEDVKKERSHRPVLLRRIVFASLILLCMVAIGTGGTLYATSDYETITLEGESNIEIVVNRLNRVNRVKYSEEDKKMFENVDLHNLSLNEALEKVIDVSEKNGRFAGSENFIYVSGRRKSKGLGSTRINEVEEYLEELVEKRGKSCKAHSFEKDDEKHNEPHQGTKDVLILKILSLTDKYEEKKLQKMSVRRLSAILYSLDSDFVNHRGRG